MYATEDELLEEYKANQFNYSLGLVFDAGAPDNATYKIRTPYRLTPNLKSKFTWPGK